MFRATDYLMSGGMTWPELAAALGPLASSPALAGASLACYNPEKDPGRECGRALVEALGAPSRAERAAQSPCLRSSASGSPDSPARSPAATLRTSCHVPRRR